MDAKKRVATPQENLGDILVRLGIITPDQLAQAMKEADPGQKNIGQVLIALGFASEEKISKALSVRLGIPFFPSFEGMLDPAAASFIPEALARKHLAVPILRGDNALTVGMVNPVDVMAIDEISQITGMQVLPVMTSLANVLQTIQTLYMNRPAIVLAPAAEIFLGSPEMVDTPLPQADETSVIETVNAILQDGMTRKASDIHLEVGEKDARVRFRVDGLLQDGRTYEKNLHAGLIARLKILSHLDITETRLPQDGHLRFEFKKTNVDVRLSSVAGVYGEKVVLRLLDSSKALRPLNTLGLSENNLKEFSEAIQRSNRIILVTGPTGSGKTTTLYAALHKLNDPTCNIVTLEDPVEYRIERITQIETQSKIGLTFATGLRAILRQDPNVILVGEIRDLETAEIAVQAAITGHRVFSTLHTTNAVSAVHRLTTMRVEPFLIAAALGGVMAQRLVRRLCDRCKKPHELSEVERDAFGRHLPDGVTFYEGIGCPACFNTGYAGRFAIHEWLKVTRNFKEHILKRASVDELQDVAKKEGMKTLQDDALAKAVSGLTSLTEVMRVVEQDTEE